MVALVVPGRTMGLVNIGCMNGGKGGNWPDEVVLGILGANIAGLNMAKGGIWGILGGALAVGAAGGAEASGAGAGDSAAAGAGISS